MELKASWYDNLIAGGLFWLPQLFLIARLNPDILPMLSELAIFMNSLSDAVATLLVTATLALATLLILVTGTIFEMMTSGMPFYEMRVFYRHLVSNKYWVQKALKKHALYIQEDYDGLISQLDPKNLKIRHVTYQIGDIQFVSFVRLLALLFKDEKGKMALLSFQRLYALILVRALSKTGSESSEVIVGPIQAWRLSRILASLLFFFAIEGIIVFYYEFSRSIGTISSTVIIIIVGLLALALIPSLVVSFTTRGFERVCLILFSLWYDIENREDGSREQASSSSSVG